MTFGTCRYCGQVVNLDYEEETQAEADIAASEKCECKEKIKVERSETKTYQLEE